MAHRTAMIDVGGGFRAIFGAGVMDRMLEDGIMVDHCYGVSAGSANMVSYISGQHGRNHTFYTQYAFRKEYASFDSYVKNHNYANLDYVYSTLSNHDGEYPVDYEAFAANPTGFTVVACNAEDGSTKYFDKSDVSYDNFDIMKASSAVPVDYEAFAANPTEFTVVACNADDGSTKYFDKSDVGYDNYDIMKASSAVPVACEPYVIDGVPYYDGGIADPIPVQKAIDAAKAAGADYVIGLGHLGIDEQSSPWMSKEVIANTTGFDAFIDGHSHSTFSETIKDKSGKEVVFEQTGTKLANVGKIIIKADGTITHENVDLNTVEPDAEAAAYIQTITDKFDALQKQVVAKTSVELTINGADGKRAVRNAETNLGDLCADAYRILLGADIAFVNGGGVRDNIKVGDITYGDIIKVHPFGNEACLVEVTGQQIKDALELGSAAYPGESGGFLQVSGLTYTINADIPSSVVKNDKSEFVKVDGAYRVSDIMVGGQPLDVNKTYTLASHNYMLKDAGDGYTMFGTKNVKLLKDGVMIDNQVLINYIVNNLGGVVGEQYAAPQGRITIKTAASDVPTNESEKVIAGRDTTVTEGDTYTVVAGDCLWNIAYKLYGTGTLYTKLAEANKLADPYIIYIGQILTVPAK